MPQRLQYDPADSSNLCGLLSLLINWNGTMLPMVLSRAAFWLLLFLHIGFLSTDVLYAYDIWHIPLPDLDWSTVKQLTGLLTFFIVFYGGQCYSRFTNFYGHCVGLSGCAMSWAALVKVYYPPDQAMRWNAMRLVLASMHILYYSLNTENGPSSGTGIADVSDDEWERMRSRNLLTADEIADLSTYKGFRAFLPLIWVLREVEEVMHAHAGRDGVPSGPALAATLGQFRHIVFEMRGHCGQITNWLKQPVPYPYFQFLTLLLIVDMFLVSYALVTMDFHWALTLVVYTVILTSFLGLKEVAVAMADPFGDDEIDFDTEAMLSVATKNAIATLQDDRRPAKTDLYELGNPITGTMAKGRPSLQRSASQSGMRVVKIWRTPPPELPSTGAPLM